MMKGNWLILTEDIEQYLHEHIPLSKAMGVQVKAASWEGVELLAPLAPNINHQETVFGGSASAVAILSAWSLIHVRLMSEGASGRIVIHRNTMLYERPITDQFTAIATMPDEAAWPKLVAALNRKRMARISVPSMLVCAGERVGRLEGEFVVLPPLTA
jgi:thioesterase domain-containing protein